MIQKARNKAPGAGLFQMLRVAGLTAAVAALALSHVPSAFALSEIKREELPPPADPAAPVETEDNAVPLPDPITPPVAEEPDKTGPLGPEDAQQPAQPDDSEPIPEIVYDIERLPAEVKRMRELVIEACKTGDIEKLRPLLGTGDGATQLSLGGVDGDPIAHLKGLAGDEEGQEILAILEEVLSAGYVHLDAGTPEELYVWPYFFAVPLDKLTAPQRVELFKIVTAGDYEEMKTYGSYIFYRVGFTPQGHWAFFVAGE